MKESGTSFGVTLIPLLCKQLNATIEFRVEKESPVNLSVYNIHGELVDELYHSKTSAGVHRLSWDGTDANSRLLSNGIYLLRLTTKHGATSRKICITG